MMKNLFNKVILGLIIFLGVMANAQTPPPPQDESGDIGGISQPIDMYLVWLGALAVVFIAYFVKQNSKKIA